MRLCFSLMLLSIFSAEAQIYDDHFGTGNDVGVTVSSSPQVGVDSAATTLSGTGLFVDMNEASRFLAQAGFGGSYEEIDYVTQVGIDAWITEQMNLPPFSYETEYRLTYDTIVSMIQAVHPGEIIDRSRSYADFIWWHRVYQDDDVFRNKAAYALHQILVLSTIDSKLNDSGFGQTDFYDILYEDAFGNFRDILEGVTLQPMMGYYLSHFQNKLADPLEETLPDENYAREIMQLFTIGLVELNNDGSIKLDSNGDPIPTYTIEDIQELAKVFTGLSGGAWDTELYPATIGVPLAFNGNFQFYDKSVPMIMWEEHHEPGEKVLPDGTIIPANQAGLQDINDALDWLFDHPNIGPFVAIRLIQQLVKSNPTPAYINRVAMVFNNNGQGVRGDMGAVFKAILLDPEARNCSLIDGDPQVGKLKQPLERLVALARGFDVQSPSGRLWASDANNLLNEVEMSFQGSQSVFNFFTPFYAEDEFVEPEGMVSPEFQILHSVSAIHYINIIESALGNKVFRNFTEVNPDNPRLKNNNNDKPFLDLSDEVAEYDANGASGLLDRLDMILCHGTLTPGTRTIIEDAIQQLEENTNESSEDLVRAAIYFIMLSADYTVLR